MLEVRTISTCDRCGMLDSSKNEYRYKCERGRHYDAGSPPDGWLTATWNKLLCPTCTEDLKQFFAEKEE